MNGVRPRLGLMLLLLLIISWAPGAEAASFFDSGPMALDETFEQEFPEPGRWDYICKPHAWMEAGITVVEGADVGIIEVVIEDFTYRPANVTIGPGSIVRWTNLDNDTHTVTAVGETGSDEAWAFFEVWMVVGAVLFVVVLVVAGVVGLTRSREGGVGAGE